MHYVQCIIPEYYYYYYYFVLFLLGPGHIQPRHTPPLQPTHWASINSAIASTQSSVCASGNDAYAYVHRQGRLTGIRKLQY